MQEVKLKTHCIIDRIQTLLRNFDLVCAGLKIADRFMVDLAYSIVQHRFLVKVLGIDPLQRDPLGGNVAGSVQVMAALDLELESAPHITSRVDLNADVRVGVRAHPVCPVILVGPAVENQQLDQESPSRTRRGHGRRLGCWRSGNLLDDWRGRRRGRRRSGRWDYCFDNAFWYGNYSVER